LVLVLELHDAIDQRENREITPDADILARMKLGSALTADDLSTFNGLPAINLDSEHLWIAVATVLCTTTGFFMCHDFTSGSAPYADELPERKFLPSRPGS
jgi:hypothetical protein